LALWVYHGASQLGFIVCFVVVFVGLHASAQPTLKIECFDRYILISFGLLGWKSITSRPSGEL